MKVTINQENTELIVLIEDSSEYGQYTFYSSVLDDELFTMSFYSTGETIIPFLSQIGTDVITDIIWYKDKDENIHYIFAYKEYQNCLLERILKSKFDSCGNFAGNNCDNCTEESLTVFSTLIKGIQIAETLNKMEEALIIYGFIDEFYDCKHGCGCGKLLA